MKVNEISKLNFIASVNKVKKLQGSNNEPQTDRVELSREAKALSKLQKSLSPERMAEISKRIKENFYDRDEVLNVVAERILQSLELQDEPRGNRLDKNI